MGPSRGVSGDERAPPNFGRQRRYIERADVAQGNRQNAEGLGLAQLPSGGDGEGGQHGAQRGEGPGAGEQTVQAHVPDLVDEHFGDALFQRVAQLGLMGEHPSHGFDEAQKRDDAEDLARQQDGSRRGFGELGDAVDDAAGGRGRRDRLAVATPKNALAPSKSRVW